MENRDDETRPNGDLLQRYQPPTSCTNLPKSLPKAVRRRHLLGEGKDRLLHQKHLTCKRAAWAVTPKNALVHLNELRPGLRYELTATSGPLHAPVFSVGVKVNGFHFEGQGPTIKRAKMRAAELALRSFIQFPNASQAHAATGGVSSALTDFAADNLSAADGFPKEFQPLLPENSSLLLDTAPEHIVFSQMCSRRRLVGPKHDSVPSTSPNGGALSTSLLAHLSPVVLLGQLQPGLRYTCLTERVHGRPVRSFVMVVRVEGRVFEGCGRSKRSAKARAAAAALQSIYSVSLGPEREVTGLRGGRTEGQLPQVSRSIICCSVSRPKRDPC